MAPGGMLVRTIDRLSSPHRAFSRAGLARIRRSRRELRKLPTGRSRHGCALRAKNGQANRAGALVIRRRCRCRTPIRCRDPSMPDRWIGQTAGNSAVGEYLIKLAQRFGWKTMSVVRREAAAEQVRRWGGDRVVIDDDKLESNLAQSLSDTSSTSSSTPSAAAQRGSSSTTSASAGPWCPMRFYRDRPPHRACLI